jgi:hypothetical protein
MCISDSDSTNEPSDLLTLRLYTLEKKQRKVKKEDDSTIDERICSTCDSHILSDLIEHMRKKAKYKKSDTSCDKYDKMQSIKPFTSRERESDYQDHHS